MISSDSQLIALLATEKAGFKLVQDEAEKTLKDQDADKCLALAKHFYASDIHQARMFAVLILGGLAQSNLKHMSYSKPKSFTTLTGAYRRC